MAVEVGIACLDDLVNRARVTDPLGPIQSSTMSLAAVVWHYWIGVVLFFSVLGIVVAVVAGYFRKVVRLRYPTRR